MCFFATLQGKKGFKTFHFFLSFLSMENWQRHGALPTGATVVCAQLSATAWSQKKQSRTQTKVQEAEVHLDYKTLDGTVHTVVDKAQRIGDGQIKVVYGLTSIIEAFVFFQLQIIENGRHVIRCGTNRRGRISFLQSLGQCPHTRVRDSYWKICLRRM